MAAFRNIRAICVLIISITTSLLASCVFVDGLYEYILDGRIFYENGMPVDGINVDVVANGLIDATIVPRDGYFNESLYGGMWGGEQFLFFRFYDIPEPPLLDTIVFHLDLELDHYSATVELSAEMQARVDETTRWVIIGEVLLTNNP